MFQKCDAEHNAEMLPADPKPHPPGEVCMNTNSLGRLRDCEGKGLVGCLFFLVLFSAAIYLAIALGPIYYSNFNFEQDVKAEVSRAGARFLSNDVVINDIIKMGKENDIKLRQENIKVDRFAGQVHIQVRYAVPVDFFIMKKDLTFEIKVSSFTGAL